MTEQEMWQAVQRSDASYDGRFFHAVKTTGIFRKRTGQTPTQYREGTKR